MSYRHLNVNLPPRKLLNTPKINDQRKKEKRLDLYERFKGGMNQLSFSKRCIQTNIKMLSQVGFVKNVQHP